LLVLVDGRTASSAELLAAALTYSGRGLLAGTCTFGKNYVQKLVRYDDEDLTLKISAAYLGSAGRRLPAGGLEPTFSCEDVAAARDLLLQRCGASGSPGPRSSTDSRSR
jgi:carboxyl-terminal processing protease